MPFGFVVLTFVGHCLLLLVMALYFFCGLGGDSNCCIAATKRKLHWGALCLSNLCSCVVLCMELLASENVKWGIGHPICILGGLWFKARWVAAILGYKNPLQAVRRKVHAGCLSTFSELSHLVDSCAHVSGESIFFFLISSLTRSTSTSLAFMILWGIPTCYLSKHLWLV